MERLTTALEERREMVNDHRKTWFLLTLNDKGGWNWSQAMVRELAKSCFRTHQMKMPNCPARLVCVEVIDMYKTEETMVSGEDFIDAGRF